MRVCLIADDESSSSRIRQTLSALGKYDAGPAVRVDQADAQISKNQYDLILLASGRSFDETIVTVTRLCNIASCPLLAIGPIVDPRMVLGVLRGGAVDYVDENAVEVELAPALDRLKIGRGASRSSPGRLCAVIAPSGGCGASTVAANLALAMANLHERCLAIDLKARTGDLAAMFDIRPSHTLQDLCRISSRIDRLLFEQTLSTLPCGVHVLASPRSFEITLSSEAVSRIFELGRSIYNQVVVDLDSTLPEESILALNSADAALVVLRLEFNSLRNAKSMLEYLERHGVDPAKFLLVANRVGQPKEISSVKVEEALGRKLFAKLPDDPKAAIGSQNNGVPVISEFPSSRLSKALLALAGALDALPVPTPRGT